MAFYLPILSKTSSVLSGETVRLTFNNVSDFAMKNIPLVTKPTEYTIIGKKILVTETKLDPKTRRYQITLKVL